MSEQHASLDQIAGMVAETALTLRYQQSAINELVPIMTHMSTTLTSIDGQLSGMNATLLAMLRELQKLSAR